MSTRITNFIGRMTLSLRHSPLFSNQMLTTSTRTTQSLFPDFQLLQTLIARTLQNATSDTSKCEAVRLMRNSCGRMSKGQFILNPRPRRAYRNLQFKVIFASKNDCKETLMPVSCKFTGPIHWHLLVSCLAPSERASCRENSAFSLCLFAAAKRMLI